MDSPAPLVFDRLLFRQRLARALCGSFPAFLLDRASAELEARLGAVTRDFAQAVDIGTPLADAVPRALLASGRVGSILRIAPALGRPLARVPTVIGDEEALPLRPDSFDLAVSLLSLQAVNDLPGALVQIRQALRPNGLFLG